MPKYPFKPDEIGGSPRGYDVFKDQTEEEAEHVVEDIVPWAREAIPEQKKKNNDVDDLNYKEHIETLLSVERVNQIGALAALNNASQKGFILDRLMDVLTDLYYAARDMLSGQKVKTSLTIGAGIGFGAAIGAVLGTFVFPGIGTAIGGAVGSGISAGLGAIGGTVGLSILGAFGGSWLGKQISRKIFKHEKRFELSKRETSHIKAATATPGKKGTGITVETARLMNGYLYNRTKAIQSPTCKRFYKRLRKEGIFKANPAVLEEAARFFCQELKLLEQEMKSKGGSDPALKEALQKDIDAVLYILNKLKKVEGFSKQTHKRIVKTVDDSALAQDMPKPINKKSGIEYAKEHTISTKDIQSIDEKFKRNLGSLERPMEVVERVDSKSRRGSLKYQYKIKIDSGEELQVFFKEKKSNPEQYSGSVFVRSSDLEQTKDKGIIPEVLVAQAKAYYENTGIQEVVVVAAGDDELAIALMVAAQNGGLVPRLDPREYPEDEPKAQERKKAILAEVEKKLRPDAKEEVDVVKSKIKRKKTTG